MGGPGGPGEGGCIVALNAYNPANSSSDPPPYRNIFSCKFSSPSPFQPVATPLPSCCYSPCVSCLISLSSSIRVYPILCCPPPPSRLLHDPQPARYVHPRTCTLNFPSPSSSLCRSISFRSTMVYHGLCTWLLQGFVATARLCIQTTDTQRAPAPPENGRGCKRHRFSAVSQPPRRREIDRESRNSAARHWLLGWKKPCASSGSFDSLAK